MPTMATCALSGLSGTPAVASLNYMAEIPKHRYVGDKRTQLVYDLEAIGDLEAAGDLKAAGGFKATARELLESEQFIYFAPDTLAEARNRGYRLAR